MVTRLIARGLMFGNLVPIESPVLVERYRRALKHLTGRETRLEDFHVDLAGYSPEVGDELGDHGYLRPPGFGQPFILLDLDQKGAPLLDPRFSTTRGLLRRFIDANEAQLFALTARDAVAGELVASPFGAEEPARLLDLRQVTVEADTTGGTLATAEKLEGLVRRFKAEPDAWWDDVLIAEMIALAQVTGDLTRNPVALGAMTFEQGDFWTSLWGGLYVFRDVPHPAVVAAGEDPGPLPVEVIPLASRTAVARFLAANDLAEPIVAARGPEAAAILRGKMDFLAADAAAAQGALSEATTRRELRAFARRNARALPPAWHGLAALAAWAEEGASWPRLTSEHPAYFYTLRAKRGPGADLVNRLLAELCPGDARQLFICHKEAFYRLYRTWPEEKRAWVAETLAREYLPDKAGARAALFGADAPAAAPAPGPWSVPAQPPEAPPADPLADLVARVGPWGAARRR